MSEHLHLAALAGTLFVMSYTGVAWVMAGTPMPGMKPEQLRVAALPAHDATSGRPLASAPVLPPQPVQPAALPRGDGHPQRDQLRLAALAASTAYAQTPCDDAAKAVMIQAVSAYAKAWADMMGCGPDGCDYRKINATAATFSTPLDIQLRDAVGAAFEKRGIAIDDFPSAIRINVAMLVRGRGAPATACPQTRAQVSR
ncbi:MAG TPA: hypothetical protein VFK79_13115 [Xanthobacteraceae bacterium]|nr:hypothetical protein [Xanthobacteraceae bacterium]